MKRIGVILFSFWLSACVQMPTERARVLDMRPQISFRIAHETLSSARVLVDGNDMGAVYDFLQGKAALRVLSGTHKVQVIQNGMLRLDEKVYMSDGVERSFLVQ